MSLRATATASIVALLAAWLLPCVALADPLPSESEPLVQHGIELRKVGKNAEALAQFQKAYALTPTPRGRAQIALALHALGDWLGAERGLTEALRATDDAWIGQYRDALEGALATVRAHLASLAVSINASTGELLVNGVSVHALPLREPIRVVAGTLDVAVRAPGYLPVERTIVLAPGDERQETFELTSVPALDSPAAEEANAGPKRAETRLPAPRRAPLLTYLAFGAAGALAVGGVVAWRVHENDAAIYNDPSRCLLGTKTREQQCGNYADAAHVALAVEAVAFALAAAAAGTGAWLLLAPAQPARAHTAWCGPSGGAGVVCGARF